MNFMADIRLLIVEDHPVVVWGLKSLVIHESDLRVVGEAASAPEALRKASTLRPDVIMLPLRLGGVRAGIELCRGLASVCSARLVLYTALASQTDAEQALLAGATALVPKTTNARDLVDLIRAVGSGRAAVPEPDTLDRVHTLARDAVEHLTPREQQILELVLTRRTNTQIAGELGVEITTVKTHVRSVLRKLGITSRRELFDEGRGPRS